MAYHIIERLLSTVHLITATTSDYFCYWLTLEKLFSFNKWHLMFVWMNLHKSHNGFSSNTCWNLPHTIPWKIMNMFSIYSPVFFSLPPSTHLSLEVQEKDEDPPLASLEFPSMVYLPSPSLPLTQWTPATNQWPGINTNPPQRWLIENNLNLRCSLSRSCPAFLLYGSNLKPPLFGSQLKLDSQVDGAGGS